VSASTLLRSQVRCPRCVQVIASLHVHDLQFCECGATGIDGGRDYMRLIGTSAILAGPEIMDESIWIAADLDSRQAGDALRVYKALWRLSDQGRKGVEPEDVNAEVGLLYDELLFYLKCFTYGENACVIRNWQNRFVPQRDLADRPDAP
jgi:hypothetical protein